VNNIFLGSSSNDDHGTILLAVILTQKCLIHCYTHLHWLEHRNQLKVYKIHSLSARGDAASASACSH